VERPGVSQKGGKTQEDQEVQGLGDAQPRENVLERTWIAWQTTPSLSKDKEKSVPLGRTKIKMGISSRRFLYICLDYIIKM